MPSDGGEEVIAPRVPTVPAKPTQAEQDEQYATGHAAYRPCANIVSKVEDVQVQAHRVPSCDTGQ